MKYILKVLISLSLLIGISYAADKATEIEFKKAKGMFQAKSALFIDARPEKLYKKGTILGAINIPYKKFNRMKKFLPANKKAKIVTFCNGKKCDLSHKLADKLVELGYQKVMIYVDGYPQWKKEDMPQMGLLRKDANVKKGPYKPTKPASIANAKIYLGKEDTMIDQFWFASVVTKELPKNIQLIDIRKKEQFDEGHLEGAINVRWDAEKQTIDTSKLAKDKLNVLYCNTGMQSLEATQVIRQMGVKNVLYFDAVVNCKATKCEVTANEDI